MKYYCDRCCIEYETSDLITDCICPNCGNYGTVVYQYDNDNKDICENQHYVLENSAIDTINKYENLINFIENEVYPYIQKLYYPKYMLYDVSKIKISYTASFVPKPMLILKLVHTSRQYKHKYFNILAQIFDKNWKEELKKEYQLKIKKMERNIEQKIKIDKKIIENKHINSRILSYKIMNDLIKSFENEPLTEKEQKYLKDYIDIPNKKTIAAIKELEGIEK